MLAFSCGLERCKTSTSLSFLVPLFHAMTLCQSVPGSICRKRVTASTAIPSSNGTAVGFVYTSEDSMKRSRSNMGLFSLMSMSLAQFVDPTSNTSKFLLPPNQHQVTRFLVHFLGRWTWSLQHFNQRNWLDKSGRFNPLASGPIRIDDLFGCLAFREAQFLTKTSRHSVYYTKSPVVNLHSNHY